MTVSTPATALMLSSIVTTMRSGSRSSRSPLPLRLLPTLTVNDLPEDVLVLIISYLDIWDIFSLRLTSRTLRSVLDSGIRSIARQVCINTFPGDRMLARRPANGNAEWDFDWLRDRIPRKLAAFLLDHGERPVPAEADWGEVARYRVARGWKVLKQLTNAYNEAYAIPDEAIAGLGSNSSSRSSSSSSASSPVQTGTGAGTTSSSNMSSQSKTKPNHRKNPFRRKNNKKTTKRTKTKRKPIHRLKKKIHTTAANLKDRATGILYSPDLDLLETREEIALARCEQVVSRLRKCDALGFMLLWDRLVCGPFRSYCGGYESLHEDCLGRKTCVCPGFCGKLAKGVSRRYNPDTSVSSVDTDSNSDLSDDDSDGDMTSDAGTDTTSDEDEPAPGLMMGGAAGATSATFPAHVHTFSIDRVGAIGVTGAITNHQNSAENVITLERGNCWMTWFILRHGPAIFFRQWYSQEGKYRIRDEVHKAWKKHTRRQIEIERNVAARIWSSVWFRAWNHGLHYSRRSSRKFPAGAGINVSPNRYGGTWFPHPPQPTLPPTVAAALATTAGTPTPAIPPTTTSTNTTTNATVPPLTSYLPTLDLLRDLTPEFPRPRTTISTPPPHQLTSLLPQTQPAQPAQPAQTPTPIPFPPPTPFTPSRILKPEYLWWDDSHHAAGLGSPAMPWLSFSFEEQPTWAQLYDLYGAGPIRGQILWLLWQKGDISIDDDAYNVEGLLAQADDVDDFLDEFWTVCLVQQGYGGVTYLVGGFRWMGRWRIGRVGVRRVGRRVRFWVARRTVVRAARGAWDRVVDGVWRGG